MNVIDKIEGNGYVATDKDIAELAHSVADGSRAGGTYLRVLIVAVQTDISKGRKVKQLVALERCHERMYEIIKRALGDEGNHVFARTTASTLRSWMRVEGNDIRDLDAAEATKGSLRVASGKAKPWSAKLERFVAVAAKLGREAVEDAIEQLQAALEDLPVQAPTPRQPARAH